MALTRKLLSALGIDEDKAQQIIEAHTETVNGLKDEINSLKEKADSADDLQSKLDKAQKELSKLGENGADKLQEKYNKLKEEYDNFKTATQNEKDHGAKVSAYKELLKANNIAEKYFDKILKVTDVDGLELVDGKFKDEKTLADSIKSDWSDFIATKETKTAEPANPPANPAKPISMDALKTMSVDEINKNWDTVKKTLSGAKGE
jgi:chromosome segregation ATPase